MKLYKGLILVGLFAVLASCATAGPSVVVVKVDNFAEQTEVGMATEIYFSVANVTDQELKNLTLTVTTNPSDSIDLPFKELAIDRIGPNSTWSPAQPFLITGRHAGPASIFFTVTQDGKFLAKDYALIGVGADSFHQRR
jgi:hypothetical protein